MTSPAPFGQRLPGVLQEDEFLQRFLLAFDDGVAPVFATLDNLQAYHSPALAPEDFLEWLSDWVGTELEGEWSLDQKRAMVAGAVALQHRVGTKAGVAETVRLSPRTRTESLADLALPTLKPHLIEPFLVEPIVVDDGTFAHAPRIVATTDERVLMASGDRAYVRGESGKPLLREQVRARLGEP